MSEGLEGRNHQGEQALPFAAPLVIQPGDIVIALDPQSRIIYWNGQAEQATGHQAGNVLGRLWDEVLPFSGGQRLETAKIFAGTEFVGPYETRTAAGFPLCLYLYATACRNQAGELAGVLCVGRNVTEFWHEQSVIDQLEQRFRAFFDTNPDPVLILRADGTISEANPAASRIFDYPAVRFRGLSLFELLAPEYHLLARRLFSRLVRTGRMHGKFSFRDRNGRAVLLAVHCTVLPDGLILGVGHDVTQAAHAAEQLRDAESRLRATLDGAPDAILTITLPGDIIEANQSALELFGCSRRGLMRLSFRDLFAEPARSLYHHLYQTLTQRGSVRFEATMKVLGTGHAGRQETLPVSVSMRLAHVATTPCAIVIIRDITERRENEQRILREKETAQRYLSLAGDIIVALDTSGRITLLNESGGRLLGIAPDQAIGRDWFEFVPPEQRAAVRQTFANLIAGKLNLSEHYTNQILTSRNVVRTISWHNTLLRDDAGRIVGTLSSGQDITELLKAQERATQSEANFRALAENANDGILILNVEGKYRYANPLFSRMTGYSIAELSQASNLFELGHPEQLGMLRQRLADRLAGRPVPNQYEAVIRSHTRGFIPIEVTVARTVWENEPAALVIIRDITERLRSQEQLRQSELRYRQALNAMHEPVHVCDRNLHITLVNDSFLIWLQELGLSARVIGKTIREAFPFLNPDVEEQYRQVFATGVALVTTEATELLLEGQKEPVLRHTETRKVPVQEHGRTTHVLTIIRDITEERIRELELRQAEERYRRLFVHSPDGIAVHQDGVVKTANPAAAALLGYNSPEELVGQPVSRFIHPEEQALIEARIRQALEQGRPNPPVVERFRHRDGTWIRVEALNAPFVWEGRPAVLVIGRRLSGQ